MAGHNKWSQIKHKKGAADAKKSKLFSMLSKIVAAESKKAGGNTNSPGLRTAIEKAKKADVPNDVIDRAVKRGAGGEAVQLDEFLLEGYGPAGIAILVDGVTDNKNRTISEIKHIFSKHGGSLGTPGSAAWAFTKNEEGWKATNGMDVPDENAESLGGLIEDLENHDDVKSVSTNANSSD